MADVIGAAGFLYKLDIARDLFVFTSRADAAVVIGAGVFAVVDISALSERVYLAMRNDHFAQAFCF